MRNRSGITVIEVLVILAILAVLTALLIPVAMQLSPSSPHTTQFSVQPNQRVSVEEIGRFSDSESYSGARKIFLFKDSKTGQEFIGITGVGVSELGHHSTGKSSLSDER